MTSNAMEDDSLGNYQVIKMDVTRMTREALTDIQLGMKEKDRCKNMFVLGFLYWMFNREMDNTIKFLTDKFGKKPEVLEANLRVLKAGYSYGDTTETFTTRYKVEKAVMPAGTYRSIMGNQATALGLVAASKNPAYHYFLVLILLHLLQIFCMIWRSTKVSV